jgi:predicted nucleic acid-binding protein
MNIEVTNIPRQRMRNSAQATFANVSRLREDFLQLKVTILNPAGLHHRALIIADAMGLPAAYDAHYLALSEYQNCEFWTADLRLLRQVGDQLPYAKWIGDYELHLDDTEYSGQR